jgi:CubicO group peptidase (beta-lactamase class C family)
MRSPAALIGAGGLVLVAAALVLWPALQVGRPPGARVLVNGGDAGGLPRVPPQQEHLDAAALEAASRDPIADGLQALIVMRHDYIVYERYGHGVDAETMIDSGALAQALVALVAGIAAHDDGLALASLNGFDPTSLRTAIEAGTRQSYPDYLSVRLWHRLNAAPAWIDIPAAGASAPADCCFHARVQDWLRVATLLLNDGQFEGKAVVPPGWVQRMRRPVSATGADGFGIELASAAHGAEPFAEDDVFFVRGTGRWRLWLMPTLKLAVLFGSRSEARPASPAGPPASWDETRLPNLVIRALSERPRQQSVGSQLQQLVPGH